MGNRDGLLSTLEGEVTIADAKGMLGFRNPCVWKAESVERAAPRAWYSGMLVILWYALEGITFSDMLFGFRLALWEHGGPKRVTNIQLRRHQKKGCWNI
jgi:hypothetical protein